MFDPIEYEANRSYPDQANKVYVPKLLGEMTWNFENGMILDYGCGTGNIGHHYFLPKARETGSRLYSVDISPKMIEFAKKTFPDPLISYKAGSFPDDFPFPEVQFDRIIAINVFHYIGDIKGTLRGIASSLAPGGQLGFTTTTIHSQIIRTLDKLSKLEAWQEYFQTMPNYLPQWSACDPAHLDEHLRQTFVGDTGLKEVYFDHTIVNPSVHPETLLSVFESMNPLLDNVPIHFRDRLREDSKSLLASEFGFSWEVNKVNHSFNYLIAVLEKQA